MHHASFSSADFQLSYREEPLAFCVDCHAPQGRKLGTPDAFAHGIGCESCHPSSPAHAKGPTATRATTTACESCHDFESERAPTALQSTGREHAASRHAGTSCMECHMEQAPSGVRDHRFDVSRNGAFLARAIAIGDAKREGDAVSFVLRSVAVGHRFPTGDIFRRLHVRAWVEDASGLIVADAEFALNRDWAAHRAARAGGERGSGMEPGDTRLGNEPRELRVPLASATSGGAPLRLFVRVDYERGFEARAGRLELFSTLRIAERELGL